MRKILIVDDEETFVKFLKLNLMAAGGYEIHTAFDGKKGIELARSMHPDIILLDVMMPHMDGFEVLKRLKADKVTLNIPVLMVSANVSEDAQLDASSLYCDEYITKPFEFSYLKERIDQVFQRRK